MLCLEQQLKAELGNAGAERTAAVPADAHTLVLGHTELSCAQPVARDAQLHVLFSLQVELDALEQAFAALGADAATGVLPRDQLANAITGCAEALDRGELEEALRLLTGQRGSEAALPKELEAAGFAQDVLGFEIAAA